MQCGCLIDTGDHCCNSGFIRCLFCAFAWVLALMKAVWRAIYDFSIQNVVICFSSYLHVQWPHWAALTASSLLGMDSTSLSVIFDSQLKASVSLKCKYSCWCWKNPEGHLTTLSIDLEALPGCSKTPSNHLGEPSEVLSCKYASFPGNHRRPALFRSQDRVATWELFLSRSRRMGLRLTLFFQKIFPCSLMLGVEHDQSIISIEVQFGWNLVTVKIIAYDLHTIL